MKLYHYDHCPYCVRVRLAAGLLNLDLTQEVLLNDDEATPIQLVGKKMVPILQCECEEGEAIPESLDIIKVLDTEERFADAVLPEVEALLAEIAQYSGVLLYPRMVQLPLAEFATASARAYFTEKKSKTIGDFAAALTQTEALLPRLNTHLARAAEILGTKRFIGGEDFGMNDVLLFPVLRNLSVVKDAIFPAALRDYVERLAPPTQIQTFFTQVI